MWQRGTSDKVDSHAQTQATSWTHTATRASYTRTSVELAKDVEIGANVTLPAGIQKVINHNLRFSEGKCLGRALHTIYPHGNDPELAITPNTSGYSSHLL